ncbi:MAG TPA: class I SAM-dependent methyltransferase [Candidatus Limnocylindrales bacterium]|nr:class I SAM-dependent methyltransferase [Candidatus Limnocylindrales bacterium]
MLRFKRVTELAHYYVGLTLKEGDDAVDATSGNGYDTIFLAQKVGSMGHVYAFDIQKEALERTGEVLVRAALRDRVTLIHAGHERMKEFIDKPVMVVMFNLGFLPGYARNISTVFDSTLSAIQHSLSLLAPGGIVTVVLYPGHAEGRNEKEVLLPFCRELLSSDYTVLHTVLHNQHHDPPELIVIQKTCH